LIVSLSTKYSAPQREPQPAPELSLLNRKVQKPLLALQAATESKTLLKAAEQLLHAVVPCDVVYTLLHYSMDRGRSTVAWGSDGSVFDNEYLRASLQGNPLGWVLATKPGVKTHTLRDCYPTEEAMESDPFFINFIQRIGLRHACPLIFWRENLDGADLVIGAHRSAKWPAFSPADIAAMELIHPHVDAAYRRVNALVSQRCARRGMEEFVALLPLPAILVDWELKGLFHNAAGREAAARWAGASAHLNTPAKGFQPPPDLLCVLAEMKQDWTAALLKDPGPAIFLERTLSHAKHAGLRALISMTALRSPHFGKPSFVIRFESDTPGADGRLATLTRLSKRERDLALMVSDGMSNQEIADALGRSLSTVKSELHVVFKKLEIPSRARLIALLR
jgi:DNA-binding CsgD family transcriptional regulator